MKEYHATSATRKYGFDHLPPDEMRLKDEEIKSTVEYQRETLGISNITEEESDGFSFTNSRSAADDNLKPQKVNKPVSIQDTDNEVIFSNFINQSLGNEAISVGAL